MPEADEPPDIARSLRAFRTDYLDPARVAFIMMQFGTTRAHDAIVRGIVAGLASHGITGVRADHKQYHDAVFPNVLTYMHGCGLAVAVFERIEVEQFNPNVALEVGYMLALGKPVCLLKDRNLRALHADLGGMIYRSFDPQDPEGTIPPELEKWLADKGL